MNQTRQFIDMIGSGDNVSAKELVDSILSAKAFEALEAKKQDLATTLFSGLTDAGVSEPVTVGESVEEELNLEDFTPEEIEAYMKTEEYEQLDELSKQTLQSYKDKTHASIAKKYNARDNKGLTNRLNGLGKAGQRLAGVRFKK